MADRLSRRGTMQFVPLDKMRTREEISQRKLDPKWVATIAQNFDIEDFGHPVVNHSGEWFWILDGQHRVAALKQWMPDWQGTQIQCFTYKDLGEQEEAKLFDRLNTTKAVSRYDKFRVRLTAGLPEETNIDAIVRLCQLRISRQKGTAAISCVGTLLRLYRLDSEGTALKRTLTVCYWSFGDEGLESEVLDGCGALIGRYDDQVDDERLTEALKKLPGGLTFVRQRGERLRQMMGGTKPHAIAAALVEIYNKGKSGRRLPRWWAAGEQGAE